MEVGGGGEGSDACTMLCCWLPKEPPEEPSKEPAPRNRNPTPREGAHDVPGAGPAPATSAPGSESVEDAIIAVVDAGRKVFTSCVPVESQIVRAVVMPTHAYSRTRKTTRCPPRSQCRVSPPRTAITHFSYGGSATAGPGASTGYSARRAARPVAMLPPRHRKRHRGTRRDDWGVDTDPAGEEAWVELGQSRGRAAGAACRRGTRLQLEAGILVSEITSFDELIAELNDLQTASEAKTYELTAAMKAQVATGDRERPNDTVRQLVSEQRALQAKFLQTIRKLQRIAGITEAQVRAIERAEEAARLPAGKDFWRTQILQAKSTEDLDGLARIAYERLSRTIDRKWLEVQAQQPFRLGASFRDNPLHLVNGIRVGTAPRGEGPQRFARMLLVTLDHLQKEEDLDFFSAATFVPEVAVLGNSLEEINELGPEAQAKLAALGTAPDEKVTATVFELLVGAAFVRRGISVTMVRENRAEKVPDFRITSFGTIPCAIECKRRLGLTTYELHEAQYIETLYDAIRGPLQERGIHGSIEASFTPEVHTVSHDDFRRDVLAAANGERDQDTAPTAWGTIAFRRLPYCDNVGRTRLYSPEYLHGVFHWDALQDEWDGLLCEVEPPPGIVVRSFRAPRCLKWRTLSEIALTKKSRGIASLWANALKQIPAGEIGFIYIAYPEGSRSAIADARTRHILKTMEESWHSWYVRVPVTVISRLYPRALGHGLPDLIENALPGVAKGQEHWITRVPWMIFTRQFEG
jgi:hypothetical protein